MIEQLIVSFQPANEPLLKPELFSLTLGNKAGILAARML